MSELSASSAVSVVESSLVADYIELTKPRIMFLVLIAATTAFVLGADGLTLENLSTFISLLLGTALCCAGGAALNCYVEVDTDALMKRTQNRPLPMGRIPAVDALTFGVILVSCGVAFLLLRVDSVTASLALATVLLYVLVYTPLKKLTWLNTPIGAIPGAIPCLGGWYAATHNFGWGAWVLFGILFFWQHPHFYAIAMMFRDDYKQGGFKMLSVVDATGRRTARQALGASILLLLISLCPFTLHLAGITYLVGATLLGLWLVQKSFYFYRDTCHQQARALLKATVFYLPLLLTVLLLDR